MRKSTVWIFCVCAFIILHACDIQSPQRPNTTVGFALTDAPNPKDYKAVNLDVQAIRYATTTNSWSELEMTPTQVELLKFSNGIDTLLGKTTLEEGVQVTRIRLILGDNNTLVLEDGTEVPLSTPSGQTSGIQVNVSSGANVIGPYRIVIDFNVERSVVAQGNGSFSLKPVIRAFIQSTTASLSGNLKPSGLSVRVFTVTAANDTISTLSNITNNNFFMLRGLPNGTYDIFAQHPESEEIMVLKNGLVVETGVNMELGVLETSF